MRGDVPVSKLDFIARQHDLDYIGASGRLKPDLKMVKSLFEAYPMIPGLALLTGAGFLIDNLFSKERTDSRPELQQYLEEHYLK